MTREEHLEFCKICKNQKFTMKQGIVCIFTNKIADFDENCNLFEEDTALTDRLSGTIDGKPLQKMAGTGKRFANFIIDAIFYYIVVFILSIILMIVSPSLYWLYKVEHKLFIYSFAFLFYILYYLLEAIDGRTMGKYITKTKVVQLNGEKANFKTILLRTICRCIPFDNFSYLGSDNSGWHDELSKTKVIEI